MIYETSVDETCGWPECRNSFLHFGVLHPLWSAQVNLKLCNVLILCPAVIVDEGFMECFNINEHSRMGWASVNLSTSTELSAGCD